MIILEQILKEYYTLREEKSKIENQLSEIKEEIIKKLDKDKTSSFLGEEYEVEIKYPHMVTSNFIDFLKLTNNSELIKETSTCEAFKLMDMKYKFTEQQKEQFYILKDLPTLYVKKIKK